MYLWISFLMLTELARINIKILLLLTRKSSCLTARGVSPAAHPVRGVCCPGGGGVPPARTRKGGTTQQGLGEGVPPSPDQDRGYPPGREPGIRCWGTPWKGPGTRGWTRDLGPPVDRHMPVKTLHSRRTTYAGGKKCSQSNTTAY